MAQNLGLVDENGSADLKRLAKFLVQGEVTDRYGLRDSIRGSNYAAGAEYLRNLADTRNTAAQEQYRVNQENYQQYLTDTTTRLESLGVEFDPTIADPSSPNYDPDYLTTQLGAGNAVVYGKNQEIGAKVGVPFDTAKADPNSPDYQSGYIAEWKTQVQSKVQKEWEEQLETIDFDRIEEKADSLGIQVDPSIRKGGQEGFDALNKLIQDVNAKDRVLNYDLYEDEGNAQHINVSGDKHPRAHIRSNTECW